MVSSLVAKASFWFQKRSAKGKILTYDPRGVSFWNEIVLFQSVCPPLPAPKKINKTVLLWLKWRVCSPELPLISSKGPEVGKFERMYWMIYKFFFFFKQGIGLHMSWLWRTLFTLWKTRKCFGRSGLLSVQPWPRYAHDKPSPPHPSKVKEFD